jgi:pyroglutamyl-peptidase
MRAASTSKTVGAHEETGHLGGAHSTYVSSAQVTNAEHENELQVVDLPRAPPSLSKAVTYFYITGFGRFALMEDNPTERVVLRLREILQDPGRVQMLHERLVRIVDLRILEVSAAAAHETLAEMKTQCLQMRQKPNISSDGRNRTVCFLHLGVDASADGFLVERSAVNEALFRFPDERGWQPTTPIPIVRGAQLGARYELDGEALASLCERTESLLNEWGRTNWTVRVNDDAGRFLCNYLFYLSAFEGLAENGHHLWQTFFLHCPMETVAPLAVQVDAVLAFMVAVAQSNAQQGPLEGILAR